MVNLPTHPPKGQRQALDQQWLAKLNLEGLGEMPVGTPAGPAALKLAVAQFNQGEYWQCHETLEDIWILEQYPLRLFYHGLIKAAVGLLHLERQNYLGASLKLKDAGLTLVPFSPKMMGIDIAQLLDDIQQCLELIDSDRCSNHDAVDSIPPVRIRDLGLT